jgi:NDP-sugar pyrophosphorylase family protein
MKVIIPMAGTGNRFVQQGYKDPKPLIKVNGKRIIEYILDMFDENDEIVFICNDQHIENTDMKDILNKLSPSSKVVSLPNHKKGPIFTVMPFLDLVDDNEEVIVCYCDNPLIWDKHHFKKYVKDNNLDGCILTHSGLHPHTLNSTKMAFLKTDGILMEEIKEKECYTDNPMNEHASTGVYYFKNGGVMKECFKESIDRDINYNGEYYVTLSYNLLVEKDLRVGYYDTEFVTVFGTPSELESFEAWVTILNSGQVKSEKDVVECYNYWKRYNESTQKK